MPTLMRMLPFALLLLAGCASTGSLPAGDAMLVIYQARASYDDADRPYVLVDGIRVGRPGAGEAVRVPVAAGSHRVTARLPLLFWSGSEVAATSLTVPPGGVGHVRLELRRTGVDSSGRVQTRAILSEASPEEGEARQ